MKILRYVFFMMLLSNIIYADAPMALDSKAYDTLLSNARAQIAGMNVNDLYTKINDSYNKLRELANKKNDLRTSRGLPSQKYDELINTTDSKFFAALDREMAALNFMIRLEKAIREAMLARYRTMVND
jgi:hypothetical protein